jgi:hypothetical protein
MLTGVSPEAAENGQNLAFAATNIWSARSVMLQQIRGPSSLPFTPPTLSGGTDHIVLGLRAFGLEKQAAAIGGRHLLNDADWKMTLRAAISEPSTRFTINLNGFSGSSTYSQVMGAVQRGMTRSATATEWEMAQLHQAGRLQGSTFMRDGKVLENPFK